MKNLKYIGAFAFDGIKIKNFDDITISNSLEDIGLSAFQNSSIESIDLSNTKLKVMVDKAFEGCSNLKSVKLPPNMTEIKRNAFKNCTKLTQIDLSKTSITEIVHNAFEGCTSLSSFVFPSSLNKIWHTAFKNSGLTSVDLSNTNVDKILEKTFEGCNKITSLKLSDKTTYIDQNAFKGCSSLTNLILPKAVAVIRSGAFEGCTKLSIKIMTTDENKIFINPSSSRKGYSFGNASNRIKEILVPTSALDKFKKQSEFKNYADIIKGY